MISGQNFIVIGIQDWNDDPNFNSRNMSIQLSLNNEVCYIHTPIFRSSYFKKSKSNTELKRLEVVKKKATSIQQVSKNLHIAYPSCISESINWIRLTWLFDILNRRNSRQFASQIKLIAREIGFRDFYMIIDNEFIQSQYLKEQLNPKLFVYNIRDFFTAVDYWKYHGKRLEPSIIRKADLVLSNSKFLQKYALNHNNITEYIGQGCRIDIFTDQNQSLEKPKDLESISTPIIGYFGKLTILRLDIGLLLKISKELPDCSIVLVGDEDTHFMKSELHQAPNIYFLGRKPYKTLPSYLRHFDICINPQIRNDITEGNYPLKIDEYLAAGKKVVALHTDAMEIFDPHVRLAKDSDSFIEEIRNGLSHKDDLDDIEGRIRMASSHSWESAIQKLYNALESTNVNENN